MIIGLGSMLGAGVFAAFSPAAASAGGLLLFSLVLAALLAWVNAWSSARLAALYPQSGGTYVYGRERLGPFWGYLAGWAFVVGKTASCAAMAMTVGAYLWPDQSRLVAVATVLLLVAINLGGVQKSAGMTRVLVVITLLALVAFVGLAARDALAGDGTAQALLGSAPATGWAGVLQGAGFFFFAFAGYARIATLGEEVRDPARTIPRAILAALGIVLVIYALVAVALITGFGASWIADHSAPLAAAADTFGVPGFGAAMRAAATVAAVGSLLGVILGVSRTTLAMARDRYLPGTLAAVHPRTQVPHHAEIAVGVVVIAVVLVADLRGAIGFSSFCVLTYYAIANASAVTLPGATWARVVAAIGVIACLLVAWLLPWTSVLGGAIVLTVGIIVYVVRRAMLAGG